MYKQAVENVEGRVHTTHYRIHGTLFPRPKVGIPDQLNRADQPYLPVATLDMFRHRVGPVEPADRLVQGSFMAIPRESILWVVGGTPGATDFRDFRWREVAVLYDDVLLRGKLRVGSSIRTSDYMRGRIDAKPFDSLFDVSVSTLAGGVSFERLAPIERFEHVAVNLRATTGVVELGSVADSNGGT